MLSLDRVYKRVAAISVVAALQMWIPTPAFAWHETYAYGSIDADESTIYFSSSGADYFYDEDCGSHSYTVAASISGPSGEGVSQVPGSSTWTSVPWAEGDFTAYADYYATCGCGGSPGATQYFD